MVDYHKGRGWIIGEAKKEIRRGIKINGDYL